jgi:hypothetical protein
MGMSGIRVVYPRKLGKIGQLGYKRGSKKLRKKAKVSKMLFHKYNHIQNGQNMKSWI